MKPIRFAAVVLLVVCSLGLASSALAQKSESVRLGAQGSKSVSGSVKGSDSIDYHLSLGAGQSLSVSLRSRSSSVAFNVIPPKSPAAMFIGSTSGGKMPARQVPISGEYTVRVYQLGAAAHRGRVNPFSIDFVVKGATLRPLPNSRDATIPGTPFHAKGIASCALDLDRDRTSCDAYVIRYGNASGTVEFRAGSLVRRVLFLKGKPVASDSAEAFTFSQSGDMTVLRFGDGPSEEYTVVEALIAGG